MIGKATTGSGFGGLARYLATGRDGDAPERVDWVEARNLPTDDYRLVPMIMHATAAQSHRVQKPVYHLSVSWPEEDEIDKERMRCVADQVLSDLGLADHQAIIVAHNDTDHPHLHIMVNRVHPETGKAWSTSMDYKRVEESLRGLERDLALREVPGRHTDKERGQEMRRRPSMTEMARRRRLGEPAVELFSPAETKEVRETTGPVFENADSWDQLSNGLSALGYRLRRKGQGLVLEKAGGYAKLSQITPKKARLKALEDRFKEAYKEFEGRRLDRIHHTEVDDLEILPPSGLRRDRRSPLSSEEIRQDLLRKERKREEEARLRRNRNRDDGRER